MVDRLCSATDNPVHLVADLGAATLVARPVSGGREHLRRFRAARIILDEALLPIGQLIRFDNSALTPRAWGTAASSSMARR